MISAKDAKESLWSFEFSDLTEPDPRAWGNLPGGAGCDRCGSVFRGVGDRDGLHDELASQDRRG